VDCLRKLVYERGCLLREGGKREKKSEAGPFLFSKNSDDFILPLPPPSLFPLTCEEERKRLSLGKKDNKQATHTQENASRLISLAISLLSTKNT